MNSHKSITGCDYLASVQDAKIRMHLNITFCYRVVFNELRTDEIVSPDRSFSLFP